MADISSLNNQTFSELDSSLLLTLGNGLTHVGATYVASANGIGLATYDNWIGVLGSPDPNDIVSFHTTVSNSGLGVIQYTFTQANGAVNPATGGVGAEVIAWNSTGVLLEQLTGYVPGQTTLSPDGTFLILTAPNVDLSVTDGSGGATVAQLTFGTSGAFPTFSVSAVPEPSTALLMPLLIIGLMISRIPSVRAYLGAH
jgi:hypothetical protein